ncbi:hypothetical protein A2U01_0072884, partial [Trifolium medium]|nr:hypothetical protein [Trifolium medium]
LATMLRGKGFVTVVARDNLRNWTLGVTGVEAGVLDGWLVVVGVWGTGRD